MSAKKQEVQQELFEEPVIVDPSEVVKNIDNIEILKSVDHILVVKETGTGTNEERAKPGLSFEEGVARLEQIIGNLEQKDIPLENALAIFREGVELVQECNRMLDQAETQMQILLEGPDGELKLEKAEF
ncbi:MAG: exodeoxyribonuclease VII small subunit [Desulfitobacteriaceae bacterium]